MGGGGGTVLLGINPAKSARYSRMGYTEFKKPLKYPKFGLISENTESKVDIFAKFWEKFCGNFG